MNKKFKVGDTVKLKEEFNHIWRHAIHGKTLLVVEEGADPSDSTIAEFTLEHFPEHFDLVPTPFKVGDVVRLKESVRGTWFKGYFDKDLMIVANNLLFTRGDPKIHVGNVNKHYKDFYLVKAKPTEHKHATLIKLWADGASIQELVNGKFWVDCVPDWTLDKQFRVKEEGADISTIIKLLKNPEILAVVQEAVQPYLKD